MTAAIPALPAEELKKCRVLPLFDGSEREVRIKFPMPLSQSIVYQNTGLS
jgi:hypothetical protein